MPPLERGVGAASTQEGVKYSLNETVEESFFDASLVRSHGKFGIHRKINGWNLQITYLERKMIFQTSMISILIFRGVFRKMVRTYPLTIMVSKKSWHIFSKKRRKSDCENHWIILDGYIEKSFELFEDKFDDASYQRRACGDLKQADVGFLWGLALPHHKKIMPNPIQQEETYISPW